MSENTGGTVRYHRAEYLGDVSFPWEVWFDGGQGPIFFTAEQGEAMGLTPPPAPLVVTCNGHSVDVPEWELDDFIAEWGEDGVEDYSAGSNRLATRFAYWLRDARQDPQPAEALDLTDPQARCLAHRLIANHLATVIDEQGIDWEMVPELSESAWLKIVAAVDTFATETWEQSKRLDRVCGVDSAHLMEKAT